MEFVFFLGLGFFLLGRGIILRGMLGMIMVFWFLVENVLCLCFGLMFDDIEEEILLDMFLFLDVIELWDVILDLVERMVFLRFIGFFLVVLVGLFLCVFVFLDILFEIVIDFGVIDECFFCVCDGNLVGFLFLCILLGFVMKGIGVSFFWVVFEEIMLLDFIWEFCFRGDKFEEGGDFCCWFCFLLVEEIDGGRE